MGKLFELIADQALEKLDDYYEECHVCNAKNTDLYAYHGKITFFDGTVDDDISAVCSDCILTKPLTHICDFEYVKTIENYLDKTDLTANEKKLKKEKLITKYQRTPDIPIFMQYSDRPLCCNDITEFLMHPKSNETLYEITENSIYWEQKIKEKSKLYDFRKYGNPESMSDVAAFKCSYCHKKYFTFQFT